MPSAYPIDQSMLFESATQRLDNLGCKSGVRSPCHTTEVGGGPSGVVTLASATEEPVTCLSYCLSMLRMGKVSGALKDGHKHSKHCRPVCTHASSKRKGKNHIAVYMFWNWSFCEQMDICVFGQHSSQF